ncbi:MAG: phosphodiester glycosidase family protein [Candidatus Eisenbacteria bacterium]|uniref:Phosphodiester glycosidase family protein n=1 Tax=Eiseniibacteriota bacterium TaxID=2212470 RepID=A0A937XAN5_UNCEI|nr:phosphodiester glycosidase family protein [Candidatus Eisenbacteria bacterium]
MIAAARFQARHPLPAAALFSAGRFPAGTRLSPGRPARASRLSAGRLLPGSRLSSGRALPAFILAASLALLPTVGPALAAPGAERPAATAPAEPPAGAPAAVSSGDPAGGDTEGWRPLAAGLELGRFTASRPARLGDSRLAVLRIDPRDWALELAGLDDDEPPGGRTARQWSEQRGYAAAINAGMFATDYRTHIGYARSPDRVWSDRLNGYRSVAAFDPRAAGVPLFRIFDLDAPGVTMPGILEAYGSAVQNLRLIERPGRNRWSRQERMWSEAALGEDDRGRILFLFCRAPYSMHDLNEEWLALGVVCAQHLEGGPEAQLFIRVGDFVAEFVGSFETAFTESDANAAAWPVPNVLGLRPRAGARE